MEKDSIGIVAANEFVFGGKDDERLVLTCGKKIGPVVIRYETYGELNSNKSNAILILHALTGDAHVAGYHSEDDRKPGWWNEMVGPGKPFDTDQYYIVCSNVIGGCAGSTGPRSINPETGKRFNMTFPVITITDMVDAQERLMQHLGIERWLSIAGGSMGGMQALEWVTEFPRKVGSVIAIATTARLSAQSIAFDWVGREAIMSDPKWDGGNYEDSFPERGLAIARMLAHITYLSDESMYHKFGRKLQDLNEYAFDFARNFAVESYLEYQGQRFVERFDANSYLYITRAMDYFDVAAKGDGGLSKAFSVVECPFLVVSFTSDWLFPSYQARDIVHALLNNNVDVTYCDINSSYGHDAFLLEVDTLGRMISSFLANRFKEIENG